MPDIGSSSSLPGFYILQLICNGLFIIGFFGALCALGYYFVHYELAEFKKRIYGWRKCDKCKDHCDSKKNFG